MVQIFCKLCLQSVSATDWKPHIAQKQHLQQLPCKIVATGSFKDKVDEVYTYFGKFGGIRGQNVAVHGGKVAIEYRFWDARVYSEVIHQEHTLFGQQIEISWYKKVKAGPLQHVVQDEKMSNERFVYCKLAIINTTKGLSTFAEQIEMFQKQLNIIKNEMEEHRKTIHDDLTTALAPNFPHNKIHFFGSTITELEIHDSDLNIYVDNTDFQLATLELIKDLITKNENFTNVLLNSENNNSVVKCRHVKSRISCEVTIRNELPVGNSELIKYYITLDEKLKPLMLFIKFWADCYELRGENFFSSYALYLMVIFYLQREPHKLPSVLDLQKDMPSDEIDGWNCAFGPVEFTSPSLEKSTILDLVTGFFRFYSNFNYMSHVISLYFGSSIGKTRFLEPHDLPECFDDYVKQNQVFPVNSGMCIQDPFEHSRNVSIFVPLECVGKFTAVCRNSLELIKTKEAELFYRLLLAENPVNQFHLEKNEWDKEGIKELVLKILREIFCCQVEEITSEEAHVTFSCQGQYNVWDKRSDFLKNIMTEFSSEIEQEIAVTSCIIRDSAPNFTWEMGLQLTFDKDKVTFVLKNENSVLLHLGHFLYVKLAKLLTENPPNEGLSPGIPMDTEEIHGVEEKPQIEDQSQAEEISKLTPSVSAKQNLENAVFEFGSENAQQANDSNISTNFANEDLDAVAEMVKNGNETNNKTPVSYFSSSGSNDEDRRLLIIQSLVKGQSFAEETAFMESKFRRFQTKMGINRKVISEDLFAILIPVFPQIRICFYIANITCLNMLQKRLKIHLADVSPQAATLELIKNMIGKNENFSDVVVTSKCDGVIACKHVATDTCFDLSMQNNLSVCTSELFKYYISLDERLPTLMMIIKFWFDANTKSFPHNAVYLMVIFYLQQEPYKLPSVADLQKNVPVDLVDGWNCAFSQVKCENDYLQKASLLDLVTDFFRYYDSVDYFSYVISPYFGSLIEKTHFLKPYNLPDCYQQYVNQNEEFPVSDYIDIQHPFEHSRNIVESHNVLYSFTGRCRHAFILTQNSKISLQDLLYRNAENISVIIENNKWDRKKWTEFVKVVIKKTLSSFVDGTLSEGKKNQATVYIGGLRKFWEHRTQVAKNMNLPPEVSDIDKEIAITRAVTAQFPSKTSAKLEVRLKFKQDPCRAIFTVKTIKSEMKYCMQHFIYVKLLKFWKIMEADADLADVGESSSNLEYPKRTGTYTDQVAIFQEKVETSKPQTIVSEIPMATPMEVEAVQIEETAARIEATPTARIENPKGFIISSIAQAPDFASQAAIFVTKLLHHQTEMAKNHNLISEDLSTLLSPIFPQSKICFYNTDITGLNLSQSILKIYLADVTQQAATLELIKSMIGKCEKFCDVSQFDAVIRFKHVATETCCDLNIQNRLPVCTSELIKYYMLLNEKLPKLMRIIRFWFDLKVPFFPNDAVYLMVIFFLQQEPYKLPSVADLQKNVPVDLVDGWNCAFSQMKYENEPLQKASLLELVTDFFRFYENFDYFSYVISPYFGSVIEKTHFLKPYSVPECYQGYVGQSEELTLEGLVIQDPFKHCQNVSEKVSSRSSSTVFFRVQTALKLLEEKSLHLFFLQLYKAICLDFTIENVEEDRETWIQSIRMLTVKVLKEVFCCSVEEKVAIGDGTQVTYICKANHVWENRVLIAKSLKFPADTTELDKEIAITSAVCAQFPFRRPSTIFVDLNFKQHPRLVVSIERTKGKIKFVDLNSFKYFVFLKLLKLLKSNKSEENKSTGSVNSENFKQTILDTIKHVRTFDDQVTIFQNTMQAQPEECHKSIEDDLSSALTPSVHLKKIFCESGITGLNVFIDCEEVTVQKMIDLLSKSGNFCDVVGNSYFNVIRCRHNKTHKICDLNVSYNFAENELIRQYLSLNDKLRPLFLVVKFWADCHQLAGFYGFSASAIYMLVIFFLQQKYSLPSVLQLQKTKIREFTNSTLQNATIKELLSGFFNFYATFDYISYVISPYFGAAIGKIRFLPPYDLPECFQEYVNQNKILPVDLSFCVQDVHDHSKNVSLVPLYVAGRFACFCRNSVHLLAAAETVQLHKLLEPGQDWQKFNMPKFQLNIKEVDHQLMEFTTKIVEEVLKCQLKIERKETYVSYQCDEQYNIWNNRLSCSNKLKPLLGSDLDKEIAVTSRVIEDFPFKSSCTFEVRLQHRKSPRAVDVIFMKQGQCPLLLHLCHFAYIRYMKFFPTATATRIEDPAEKGIVSESETATKIEDSAQLIVTEVKTKHTTSESETTDFAVISEIEQSADIASEVKIEDVAVESEMNCTEVPMEVETPAVVSASTSSVSSAAAVPPTVSTSGEEREASSSNYVISPTVIVSSPSPNQGSLIQVEPRILNRQQKKNILKKGDLPTFAAQVAHMYTYFRMDKDEIEKYEKIIHEDLTSALTVNFKFGKIHFFGSTVLGLFADDGSVDVYIEKLEQPGQYNLLSTLNLLKDCLCNSGKFLNGSIDASGVSCTNLKSKMRCKIHINNKLSIYNTQLIEYYLTLDSKLHSFMFTVKTWAEFCQLKLHGRFSNYILYLMVIFYLQQEPYNFPTVADVQRNAPPNMVDGWNGTFVPLPFTNQALKDATILDLVIGFFKFYSNFNFFSYVISPFYGTAIERTRFLKPFNLPPCYANYEMVQRVMMVNSPLCVQDPFEHSRNVSSSVSLAWASRFAAMCRSLPAFISLGEKQLLYKLMCHCQSGKTFDHQAFVIEKQENMNEFIWIRTIKDIISSILTDFLGYKSVRVKEKRVIESTQLMTLTKGEVSRLKEESGDIEKILFICGDQQKLFKNATLFEKNAFGERGVLNVEAVIMRNPTRVRISVFGAADKLHVTHFIYIKMLPLLEKKLPKEKTILAEPLIDLTKDDDKISNVDGEPQPKDSPKSKTRKPVQRRRRSRSHPRCRSRCKSRSRRRSRSCSRSHKRSRSRSRSRRRSRSRSRDGKRQRRDRKKNSTDEPLSPRPNSRKHEATKRKSFLEEIREKLNEIKAPVPPQPPVIHNLPPYVYMIPRPLVATSIPPPASYEPYK